ncbi:hypothetical protein B0H63DRAFT_458040 [Podospora didyma]|uniref:Secreted protein n=1 Tax=Podospora didyma TaxID=330526 RepID=A0AAE0U7J6_9PEZI|nr:hypothetical protein B0H63DRAFT_458040 [Podospora didyma]
MFVAVAGLFVMMANGEDVRRWIGGGKVGKGRFADRVDVVFLLSSKLHLFLLVNSNGTRKKEEPLRRFDHKTKLTF